jgi:hypothetical protein
MNTIINQINSFPTQPSSEVSDRYMFIDSRQVIEDMRDLGYVVAGIRKPNHRTDQGNYGLHEIDFRLEKYMLHPPAESPRILFLNSYDGSHKAQIISGVFRQVCSNGLVVGTTMAKQKFMHLGDFAEDLLTQIKENARLSEKVFNRIENYKGIELDKGIYLELAKEAVKLRYPDNTIEINPMTILQPRRKEDTAKDLWSTFNVIQENLVKGGIPSINKKGKVKPLTSLKQITQTNKLNMQLWDLTESFAAQA